MNLESFDPKDTSSIIIITYRNKKRRKKTKMFLMAKRSER